MKASKELRSLASPKAAEGAKRFFKTGKEQYAEHDKFLGVSIPQVRTVAKNYYHLELDEIEILLSSPYNEERFLALVLLVKKYESSPKTVFDFYIKNLGHINNWNLVDASAHFIVGRHLLNSDKSFLLTLAKSKTMWHRRIAVVATWYFIRNNHYDWTIKLAEILLNDTHDLMHKATGWMLREVGKKDEAVLLDFLENHYTKMPRTMLRYSIERLNKGLKTRFLGKF
jgi:3-methyladenine DNA glycosylase AlkD